MIHHLIIRPRSARTACLMLVDVYFPGTGRAVSFKPVETSFECTTDEAQATCLACHKNNTVRDTLHRDVPVNPREPKRFERVDGDHNKCIGCVTVDECIDLGCERAR